MAVHALVVVVIVVVVARGGGVRRWEGPVDVVVILGGFVEIVGWGAVTPVLEVRVRVAIPVFAPRRRLVGELGEVGAVGAGGGRVGWHGGPISVAISAAVADVLGKGAVMRVGVGWEPPCMFRRTVTLVA